ncbi:MAG: acylneuraminate cytidylyltransferase family protein [Syntrophales bacterium]|jgi:N-acylneuraminate cytidylyltransferase/CMP-N,N'-diacetyllegionaminic acid synthase|nr:acylneuraminate cytidylyltransferase family protein [Syntrophales bacterium]MDY0043769.1 acylneuraminate cytidylyltransferase family protein [Syntrophales bacterium]
MNRLCTVCARGGSKGIKNKNLRNLKGRPLIAFSIEQARESGLFDLIAVSSDSDEILDVAGKYGADLLIARPQELATDNAAKLPAIRHCVTQAESYFGNLFDIIVDLDATSPLRLIEDIHGAVDLLERTGASNIITAAPARRSPYFNLVELDKDEVVKLSKPLDNPVVRRQDSPRCFDMNASIYVWKRSALFDYPTIFNDKTRLFVMPAERSVDIDSELDFDIVELILRRRNAQ